MTVSFSEKGWN